MMSVDADTLRVVLIAEEAVGSRVLRLLGKAESVAIEAVFVTPDGAGEAGSVGATAERMGVPVLPAKAVRSSDAAAELAGGDIDLVLNIHSLYLVHPSLLELPRLGAYNLHPGPLPEMAGLNVPSWAILLGHDRHGVTLHRMSAGLDEGAVAFEDRFPVAPDATGLTLSVECARRGVALVERLVETAARGAQIPAHAQDLSRREYFDRHPPDRGSIDFDRPAHDVAAHVRAADYRPFTSPWGPPRVLSDGMEIGLVKASAPEDGAWEPGGSMREPGTVRIERETAWIACADGWVRLEDVMVRGEVRSAVTELRDGATLTRLPSRVSP